jgi:uncharacterized membrane protein
MSNHKSLKYFILTLLACLCFGILYTYFALLDHWNGNSGVYDLGLFEQVLYRKNAGLDWTSTVLGKSIFADHFSLVFFPIYWIYKIFPFTETLLILQSLVLALSGLLVYFLARNKTCGPRESFGWSLLFLIYPSILYINLWDFHPMVFVLPLLLLALIFEARQDWAKAAFFYASTFLIREEFGLVVAGVGLMWIVFKRNQRIGLGMMIGGFLFFTAATNTMKMLSGTEEALSHLERYSYLGQSPAQIFENIAKNPLAVLEASFTWRKVLTLVVLFLPLMGLTLLSGSSLICLVIPLGIHYLSLVANQFDFRAHYMSSSIPFIFAGALEGKLRAQKWFEKKGWNQGWITPGLFLSSFFCSLLIFIIPPIGSRDDLKWPIATSQSPAMLHLSEAMASVNHELTLVTSNALGAQVADRQKLVLFGQDGKLCHEADTALLVDLAVTDPWPFSGIKEYAEQIRVWLKREHKKIGYYDGNLLLLVPGTSRWREKMGVEGRVERLESSIQEQPA